LQKATIVLTDICNNTTTIIVFTTSMLFDYRETKWKRYMLSTWKR